MADAIWSARASPPPGAYSPPSRNGADVAVLEVPWNRSARSAINSRVEDRAVARLQHRARSPRQPHLVLRRTAGPAAPAARAACRTTAAASTPGSSVGSMDNRPAEDADVDGWSRGPRGRRTAAAPTAAAGRTARSRRRRAAATWPWRVVPVKCAEPARSIPSARLARGRVMLPMIIHHATRHPARLLRRPLDVARRVPRLRRRVSELALHLRAGGGRRARVRAAARAGRPVARATRSSSGARTGPSGSSPSGAACCAAWSWSRSTTAPRATSWCACAPSSRRASCSPARTSRRRRCPTGVASWPLRGLLDEPTWRRSTRRLRPDGRRRATTSRRSSSRRARRPSRRGCSITHRNVLANIVPIENEVAKYRKYGKPFFPIRFLNLLPLSHMFGQSMATFVPADAAGRRRVHAGLQPARDPPADPQRVASRSSCRCRRSSTCCASTSGARSRRPCRRSTPSRTGAGGGGATGACTGRSARSSGRSSSGPRRWTPGSRSS